jgi:hypothetical protein
MPRLPPLALARGLSQRAAVEDRIAHCARNACYWHGQNGVMLHTAEEGNAAHLDDY